MLCDIIDYVKEAGYLNDNDYIKRTINEYKALKNLSIYEIMYKLYQKGIKKTDIEDYISDNYDDLLEYEISSANNIVNKKLDTMEKEEIRMYLIKKGYREETVKEVL